MHPELLSIPPLGPFRETMVLHTYGVMIATGFVLATWMMGRQARRMGEEDPDAWVDLAFRFLVVGLIGARALFIVVNWADYSRHPLEIFYFWRGGLVFYGGFLLALAYGVYWAWRNRVPFFKLADFYVPFVAFNLAWGRLGCLAAGCCYGAPTRAPWAIRFPYDTAAQVTQHGQGLIGFGDAPLPVHPTQLYEAASVMALFLFLQWLSARKRYHGQLLLTWLFFYPLERSIVEALRGDVERGFLIKDVLSTSQFVSILVLALAALLLVILRARATPRAAAAQTA